MIQWREGRVVRLVRQWRGAVELEVDVYAPGGGGWVAVRALAYPAVVGVPAPGERVLLNTTTLERGLGTGGYAFVVGTPDGLPAPDVPPAGAGHVVKARYTPQQVLVQGVEEQESPSHELLRDADDLFGLPVVVADLHSALPAVVAGIRERDPGL